MRRVALLLISLALPAGAAAQTVQGRLLAPGDAAVPAARVQLVAGDGELMDEAVSGVDGRFAVTAPDSGSYRIVATPAGGSAIAFGPFALAPGERKELVLRMPRGAQAEGAVALAPVTATAQPWVPTLERHGFYERKHLHPGRFVTQDEFARLPGITVLDHVRALGILLEPRGAGRFALYRQSRGEKCYLAVYLDNQPFQTLMLDRLRVDQVAGVEYYHGSELPLQFNPYYSRREWNCGAVVIWTQLGGEEGQ